VNPTSHYLGCEGREIHYTAWGEADAPALIAWHGLARTGRDMDDLAAHLAPRAVVAEIAGCGHAPALNTPAQFAIVERFLAA
jgi:pimeloyl-ACP methyl ester carboxylesterase